MDYSQFQTGDRAAIAGKHGISVPIIKCMIREWKKEHPNEPVPWIPSHWLTITMSEGVALAHGSIINGFKPEPLEDAIDFENDSYIIVRTKNGYSQSQKQEVVRYSSRLEKMSIMYNFIGIFLWILYIYLRIDWFPKYGGEKMMYCYSSTKRIMEHVDPSNIPYNANKVNAWDPHREDDREIIKHII